MGNWHNNVTHISSVVIYVGMVDMHTLFPWPCQLIFHIYDAHTTYQRFYMSQIDDYTFYHIWQLETAQPEDVVEYSYKELS